MSETERPGFLSRIGADRPLALAAALSLLWVAGVAAYAVGWYSDPTAAPQPAALEALLFLLAAVAPPALFLFAALLLSRAEAARAEAERLVALLSGAPLPAPPPPPAQAAAPANGALEARLARIESAIGETRSLIARIEGRESAARRDAKRTQPPKAPDEAQPALPLAQEAAPPTEGVRWTSVVRALDFPRDKADKAGFAALKAMLRDPEFAELMQAAEDVLTLFSEDGLYMEDLAAAQATPEDWRRYAAGARGEETAACGGVTDEVALALVRARMRSDVVFRDGALHFLRRFDRFVRRMAGELGADPLIVEAADTRTGRAFQILARVTGAFG